MPAKWFNAKRNQDDQRFFVGKNGSCGLVRSKFTWRSIESIAKEADLPEDKTKRIADYFIKLGIVVLNKKNGYIAYFENVKAEEQSDHIQDDQNDRIQKEKN